MNEERPIAVTMGEPGGIGAEITVAAWMALRLTALPFVLIDDPDRLRRLLPSCPLGVIGSPGEAAAIFAEALPVLRLEAPVTATLGRADPANSAAVIESIERAVAMALDGEVAAVVTNPIQKGTLYAAGFSHPGHTEFLAALTGAPLPVMMIASPALRVVPVTIHIALAAVPGRLTAELIVETVRIVARDLARDFGIAAPRIAVAGLNPHAGEDGAIGTEDRDVVRPAVERLRRDGLAVAGPLPADTMFQARARERYDVAICMYHDQALIPAKTLDFDGGVNVTLGLPIIRTSPDHGTALDIAGQGIARPDSLVAALKLARDMARQRAQETA
ncbi:MAG TPA: 4-hydroxythreonine-4-phosphate dehydrogenase PdxA [Lichenihabitans sp.]|jgi:4-hydroxythreonine-4-phosphate dehydrogenase|nr:4-hydroxythreonine-4-phosphate dehydrogenase PdxA [Lichenihabitans sp.]